MATRTFFDDFFGDGATTVPTSASWNNPWKKTVTAASGTPQVTFGLDNGSSAGPAGILHMGFTNNTQIENLCVDWGNVLSFSIDDQLIYRTRLRLGQATIDSATSIFFGLGGDRNDTITSIAQRVGFTLVGSVSTSIVYVVTDDGVTDSGNISTGVALSTGWKDFEIRIRNKTNILFSMTGADGSFGPIARGTVFSMSGYSGAFQPYYQIQKTSDNNQDYLQSDFIEIQRTPTS
jgi:hypothetical protein